MEIHKAIHSPSQGAKHKANSRDSHKSFDFMSTEIFQRNIQAFRNNNV